MSAAIILSKSSTVIRRGAESTVIIRLEETILDMVHGLPSCVHTSSGAGVGGDHDRPHRHRDAAVTHEPGDERADLGVQIVRDRASTPSRSRAYWLRTSMRCFATHAS